MVRTTLGSKDSAEDFEVQLLELAIVGRVGGTRHTRVRQRLDHLGLQTGTFRLSRVVVLLNSSVLSRL